MLNYDQITSPSQSIHILCDFDGTISLNDTTDLLLNHFAKEGWEDIETQWENGLIGSQLCMQKQVELLDMSKSEFLSCLDQIELDLSFKELLNFCEKFSLPITIVSDGLDLVIEYLLEKHHIHHIPVIANKLIQRSEREWSLEFPNANPLCIKESGTCKCKVAEQSSRPNIILIGDGRSDFCLANNAHFIFAKSSLIKYCEENNLPFQSIFQISDSIVHLQQFINLNLAKA
jgi:2-hydroxy-3-keto-5-methylthiopentenyl-1-phosphate phosphatase